MDSILSKRIILMTGKGGVGRSSVTAALAKLAARSGKRVLVAEVGEPGHDYSPLARIFGRDRLPESPELVEPGIHATFMLAHRGQERFLSSVLHAKTLVHAALSSEAVRSILRAAPSFREMGIFYDMLTFLREERPEGGFAYEFVIIDMPATGHALALTTLPQILLNLVSRGPIATALREGLAYFGDSGQGAAYIVTLPETLPVSEALELAEGLKKSAMPVGGVFLNRMPRDPFTPSERSVIGRLIAGRAVSGADAFRRADECRRAALRLKEGLTVPSLMIPEAPGGVTSIVDFIMTAIEGAQPIPAEGVA